jgi:hypothetical protein
VESGKRHGCSSGRQHDDPAANCRIIEVMNEVKDMKHRIFFD